MFISSKKLHLHETSLTEIFLSPNNWFVSADVDGWNLPWSRWTFCSRLSRPKPLLLVRLAKSEHGHRSASAARPFPEQQAGSKYRRVPEEMRFTPSVKRWVSSHDNEKQLSSSLSHGLVVFRKMLALFSGADDRHVAGGVGTARNRPQGNVCSIHSSDRECIDRFRCCSQLSCCGGSVEVLWPTLPDPLFILFTRSSFSSLSTRKREKSFDSYLFQILLVSRLQTGFTKICVSSIVRASELLPTFNLQPCGVLLP